jgi:hypothetical protein
VDYHMATGHPSAAIDLIESLEGASLVAETRREIMIIQASCHNKLRDYQAAKEIYQKLSEEFPSEEIDKMAKRNDERILEQQEGGALVLEKTTSLQDD